MAALPYLSDGQLVAQDGSLIRELAVSVWPASSHRDEPGGVVYDHTGEAPLGAAAQLQESNVSIVVAGVRYRVVEAIPNPLLPHVALRLRRARAGA